MTRSLVAVLAFFLGFLSAPPPAVLASSYPAPFLRLRGGLAYQDPDRDPGSGWLVGGALGFPLNRTVAVSLNYDHMDLGRSGSMRGVNPMTAQLEVGVLNRHRVTPRVELGAGFYDIGWGSTVVVMPLSESIQTRRSTGAPFGMSFGGGLSFALSKGALFDVDARYHQTMGFDPLVMSTVSAGLTFKLGRDSEDAWASR